MIEHSSAVFKHISNFVLISVDFLNMQRYTEHKRWWLTELWNVRFHQVPAVFAHPRVYPCPENMCLCSARWKGLWHCRWAMQFMQTCLIWVTSFLAMWFSKYATLSIQTWRKKEISSYLVYLNLVCILHIIYYDHYYTSFHYPCYERFDSELCESQKNLQTPGWLFLQHSETQVTFTVCLRRIKHICCSE